MPKRTRAGVLTALAVVGLTAGTALSAAPAGAAPKAPAPRFLAASELPPHSTGWTADKVKGGVPEEMQYCFGESLLAYTSSYRTFRTDLDTGAQQLNVVVGNSAKAKALATRLDKDVKRCVARMDADPDVEADHKSYGSLPVEEGARVHGFATRASWGAMDIHLVSVGRDGGTVTVVQWGQMGGFKDAPVKAFKKTTTTAVNKLY
ncbi:hypothetical protein ACWHLZ_33990 [Streptomyces chartreusis]|uniref:hypothetical protein n=1 Tax=Streptomyces TaxID=1883 RepID=UPI002E800210|nr:hypothetical protein [Streptomyces chartreusis]WSZ66088.1 hypothetical protein OG938_09670 [Streptomyces chartreusis]WUB21550.1 hypothetical protein OG997_34645 [Streptomyces chartreusis]